MPHFSHAHRSPSLVAITLLFLVGSAAGAGAQDAKVMSGFECVDVSGTGMWKSLMVRKLSTDTAQPVASNTYPVTNNAVTDKSIDVVCPIVRDNATSTNGLTKLNIWYYQSASPLVRCKPYSLKLNGANVKSAATDMPERAYTTVNILGHSLDWTAADFGANSSVAEGPMFVKCNMGAGTSLLSIRYEETEATPAPVADDTKIVSGFACLEVNVSGAAKWLSRNKTVGTSVAPIPTNTALPPAASKPPTSNNIDVVCPLSRDDTDNVTGLENLKVYYFSSYGTDVTCTPYFVSNVGGNYIWGFPAKTSGRTPTSGNAAVIEWKDTTAGEFQPAPLFPIPVGFVDGTYMVKCNVAPGAQILAISYKEN